MKKKTKNIMVLLPTSRDREGINNIDGEYAFHWMDDEHFRYPQPKEEFDLIKYTEACSDYVETHDIDGVFYSHDLANLVAGILCDRHDFIGPKFESIFLTNHKYYSRSQEPTPIWFDYIDLDTGEWGEREPQYPCYIKPPFLTMTLFQYRVNSQEEMDEIVKKSKERLHSLSKLFNPFFKRYVDLDKYPLANRNILVVEELVENAEQHCVEGWFDSEGNPHIWAISDQLYYPGEEGSTDVYLTPSLLPEEIKENLKKYALRTIAAHGLNRRFWNMEVWQRGDWITATEINSRSASVWKDLYKGVYQSSIYKAMTHLSCGEDERCLKESPKKTTPRFDGHKIGGQFHVVTFGEGKAEELLDFEKARRFENPQIEILVSEGTEITQTRSSGYWLARFQLYGETYEEISKRADKIREEILLQPEKSPQTANRESVSFKS